VISKSPCDRYIKYLLVHDDEGRSDEEVVQICHAQELDPLGTYHVRRLRVELTVPVPFYPLDRTHRPSFRFLMAHGIRMLFHPDEHMRAATKLLGYSAAKEVIETMILSKAPMQWIVSALQRAGYAAHPETIECYRQHYFDLAHMNQTQIRMFLRLRHYDASGGTDPEMTSAEIAYEKAKRLDPRLAAANSPIPGLAAMVAALRIGIRPEASALANMASTSRTLAVLRMIEAGVRDGYDDAMRAAQWAAVAKVSGEILEDVGSPEADFNSKLTAVTLQTEEAPVAMLGALSGGHHTTSMEMIEDAESEQPGAASKSGRGGTGRPSQGPPSR
jgi:hypothetical protein